MRKASAEEVHVDPTQGQELSTTGSSCGSERQIEVESRIASGELEQLRHLPRRGWAHLDGLISGGVA